MRDSKIFITGGTGFVGRALIVRLLECGHSVEAVVRPGSESRLPKGAVPIVADPLDGASYQRFVRPEHVFVQLVGVSHPSPLKQNQFEAIDARSGLEAVRVARSVSVRRFVYLSVAQPAPIMQAYIRARKKVEDALQSSGLSATILRPWYILGPGRRWPLILQPLYWILGCIPFLRGSLERLGFVTLDQMAGALVRAVEDSSLTVTVWNVPDIRREGAN